MQCFLVVDVPVVQVHLGVQTWTRSLTCPLLSTTGFLHSGGASDTVHGLLRWTFQLCNADGYDTSSIFLHGGVEWDFDAFCVIAPPVVLELRRQFLEPSMVKSSSPSRAPLPICTTSCRHGHLSRFSRFRNHNNNDDNNNNNNNNNNTTTQQHNSTHNNTIWPKH